MPAQKRSHDALEDDPTQNNHENGHEQPEDEEGTCYFAQIPTNQHQIFPRRKETFVFASVRFWIYCF